MGRGKETKNKEERKKGSVQRKKKRVREGSVREKIKSEREMKNGVRRVLDCLL